MKAAYLAYTQWLHDTNTEKRKDQTTLPLPGLQHFTHNQLFFLSFSQVWCSVATPEGNIIIKQGALSRANCALKTSNHNMQYFCIPILFQLINYKFWKILIRPQGLESLEHYQIRMIFKMHGSVIKALEWIQKRNVRFGRHDKPFFDQLKQNTRLWLGKYFLNP